MLFLNKRSFRRKQYMRSDRIVRVCRLEQLESRRLLAVYTWDPFGPDATFENPNNWIVAGAPAAAAPAATDRALFDDDVDETIELSATRGLVGLTQNQGTFTVDMSGHNLTLNDALRTSAAADLVLSNSSTANSTLSTEELYVEDASSLIVSGENTTLTVDSYSKMQKLGIDYPSLSFSDGADGDLNSLS